MSNSKIDPGQNAKMLSEWMRVMIEEIERKKAEAHSAQLEQQRRRAEQDAQPSGEHDTPRR